MNDLPDNPWAARFTELLDVTEIKHRATLTVPPLTGLNSLDIETAVNQLDTALKVSTIINRDGNCRVIDQGT